MLRDPNVSGVVTGCIAMKIAVAAAGKPEADFGKNARKVGGDERL